MIMDNELITTGVSGKLAQNDLAVTSSVGNKLAQTEINNTDISTQSSFSSNKLAQMEKAGATTVKAWETVARGLTAKKLIVDKFGDEHWEEDNAAQQRSSEIILKAANHLKVDGEVTNNVVTIGITAAEFRALLDEDRRVSGGIVGGQTGEIIDVQAYRA